MISIFSFCICEKLLGEAKDLIDNGVRDFIKIAERVADTVGEGKNIVGDAKSEVMELLRSLELKVDSKNSDLPFTIHSAAILCTIASAAIVMITWFTCVDMLVRLRGGVPPPPPALPSGAAQPGSTPANNGKGSILLSSGVMVAGGFALVLASVWAFTRV